MPVTKTSLVKQFAPMSSEDVDLMLLELGFDPEDEQYPGEVVDQIKTALQCLAVGTKALPQQPTAIAVQESASMVQQQLVSHNISIPVESLMYLLQNSIKEAQMAASVISEASRTAFSSELKQGQRRLAREMAEAAQASGLRMETIFSPQTIQKMVDAAVTIEEDVDVEKFLAASRQMKERRAIAAGRAEGIAAASQAVEVEAFDVESFIKKVN